VSCLQNGILYCAETNRTLENHIQTLVDWADGAFEQSVNQPTLPYVVVAVNALEIQARMLPKICGDTH